MQYTPPLNSLVFAQGHYSRRSIRHARARATVMIMEGGYAGQWLASATFASLVHANDWLARIRADDCNAAILILDHTGIVIGADLPSTPLPARTIAQAEALWRNAVPKPKSPKPVQLWLLPPPEQPPAQPAALHSPD